jgi:hypothetical protein
MCLANMNTLTQIQHVITLRGIDLTEPRLQRLDKLLLPLYIVAVGGIRVRGPYRYPQGRVGASTRYSGISLEM